MSLFGSDWIEPQDYNKNFPEHFKDNKDNERYYSSHPVWEPTQKQDIIRINNNIKGEQKMETTQETTQKTTAKTKISLKTAKNLVERGLMQQKALDELIAGGEITAARQAKGTALGMLNLEGNPAFPQMYFKGNSGGSKNETDEMKKLRVSVYELFETACEEMDIPTKDEDAKVETPEVKVEEDGQADDSNEPAAV